MHSGLCSAVYEYVNTVGVLHESSIANTHKSDMQSVLDELVSNKYLSYKISSGEKLYFVI